MSLVLLIADIAQSDRFHISQYTLNGKKVEIAVKRIISGETLIPSDALVNPECLQQFYNIPELKIL